MAYKIFNFFFMASLPGGILVAITDGWLKGLLTFIIVAAVFGSLAAMAKKRGW